MSVCLCVSAPQAIKNHSREMKPDITNQISPTAFQFLYMTLAIDITDGRDLSNEARRVMQLSMLSLTHPKYGESWALPRDLMQNLALRVGHLNSYCT